jgi:hypothetical protein
MCGRNFAERIYVTDAISAPNSLIYRSEARRLLRGDPFVRSRHLDRDVR